MEARRHDRYHSSFISHLNMNNNESDSSASKPFSTSTPSAPPTVLPQTNDKRFHQAYAKAIAEALLENEKNGGAQNDSSSSMSLEDAKDTYTALCYDDPIVKRREGCTALAFTLLSSSFPFWAEELSKDDGNNDSDGGATIISTTSICYGGNTHGKILSHIQSNVENDAKNRLALSDRLVQGILHTTSRPSPIAGRQQQDPAATVNMDVENGNFQSYLGNPMIMHTSYTVESAQGCAELAYTVFALGPLMCCKNILKHRDGNRGKPNGYGIGTEDPVRSFLGSYQPLPAYSSGSDSTPSQQKWGEGGDPTDRFLRNMAEMTMMENDDLVLDVDNVDHASSHEGEEKKRDTLDKVPPTLEHDHLDNGTDGNDSMEEIFAEDSDPDDYDYGDGVSISTPKTSIEDSLQNLINSFDPQILSQRTDDPLSPSKTSEMVARIRSLLKELVYSRFSTLTQRRWLDWKVSSTLSNLTLTLLRLSTDDTHGDDENCTEMLSKDFTKPLLLLRDRAMDHDNYRDDNINGGHNDDDALDEFLELIKKLLRSDAKDVGNFASTNCPGGGGEDLDISPARAVGLTSLSSLCSSSVRGELPSQQQARIRRKIRNTVIGSFDFLVDCVEYVRPKTITRFGGGEAGDGDGDSTVDVVAERQQEQVETWMRVVMALLPIFEFLNGIKIRSDYSRLDDASSLQVQSNSIDNIEGQALIQTGLFRELILLYTQTAEGEEKKVCATAMTSLAEARRPMMATARNVVREQLLRVILVMSAQSPSILGKYVARVPELTAFLYEEVFFEKNIVDATLWFTLLSKVSMANSTSTFIRSKRSGINTKAKVGPNALTKDELNKRCISGTLDLCNQCIGALQITTTTKTSNKGEEYTIHDRTSMFLEFARFTNCCTHIPTLSEGWVASISSSVDDQERVRKSIVQVLKGLGNIPVMAKDQGTKMSDGDAKKEKDISGKVDKHPFVGMDTIMVGSMRKGAKSLILLIDGTCSPQISNEKIQRKQIGSSRVSSKTD